MSAELFDNGNVPVFDFIAGMVRYNDRPGSVEAAKVVALGCRQTDKEAVLKLLADAGERGYTDFCLAHLMSTPTNVRRQTSIGKRRHDLMVDGLVGPRLVIDPSTLRLGQELRVPIAGSASRCGVWVCVGYQRADEDVS